MRLPTAHLFAAILSLSVGPVLAQEATAERPSEAWSDLKPMIFGARAIAEAGDMIRVDGPVRAHDAAVVPIEIAIAPPLGRSVKRFALIVDENPAPVAADFVVGEGMGREVALSTRIRVNAYSNVRVVAELDDGSLHQTARYVKASGGCSAPALKDAEAAVAQAGQIRLRVFDAAADEGAEAQVAIRHPNHSGFQVDQVTLLHVPAWFVDQIEVTQGDRMIFRMEGGISLSEDPSLRFRFTPSGSEPFTIRATDTAGASFEGVFPSQFGS